MCLSKCTYVWIFVITDIRMCIRSVLAWKIVQNCHSDVEADGNL